MTGGNEGGRARRDPALDGLRAVAVALVLGFHGGIGLPGGAAGVDLFLVLSGYLITGLLLAEVAGTGRVDLPAFWRRRFRRLLPALAALLATVVVVDALWARTVPAASLRLDALAALGYVANWRFVLADAGYFASFAPPSPLRHTWSLAVEEQFYVVWPLVVAACRRSWRLLAAVTLAATLASATAMALLASDPDRAHYGTDTRAQGFLVGALLALVVHRRAVGTWGRTTRAAAAAAAGGGLALYLAASLGWVLRGESLYRGGHAALALAGAALVAGALLPVGPVRRVLALGPLAAVGRVSYGLYLWHWPVDVWLSPARTGVDGWILFALRTAVAAALAVVSYRVVEAPFRAPAERAPRTLPAGARPSRARVALPRHGVVAGVLAVVVVAALALAPALGGPSRGTTDVLAAAEPALPPGFAPGAPAPRPTSTAPAGGGAGAPATSARHAEAAGASRPRTTVETAGLRPVSTAIDRSGLAGAAATELSPAPLLGAQLPALDTPRLDRPRDGVLDVTVVGDSTGFTLGYEARPIPDWIRIRPGATVGCGADPLPVLVGDTVHEWDGRPVPCEQAPDVWLWWTADDDADVVLVTLGAWEVYDRLLPDGERLEVGTPAWERWLDASIESLLERLAAAAPHALVVLPDVACFAESEPRLGGPSSERNDPARVRAVNDVLRGIVERHPVRARWIEQSSWLCEGDRPIVEREGVVLRPDGVHLGPEGGGLAWRELFGPTLAVLSPP